MHKRGRNDSFEPCNTHSEKIRVVCNHIEPPDTDPQPNPVAGKYIDIPGIGKVRMSQPLREVCWVKNVVAKRRGNRWFASVLYENGKDLPEPGTQDGLIIGVDVGLKTLAFCSDGRQFHNPRPLKPNTGRNCAIWTRPSHGAENTTPTGNHNPSKRLLKLYAKRRRLYERIADIRKNAHRQVASAIAKSARLVVVESLTLSRSAQKPEPGPVSLRRRSGWPAGRNQVAVRQTGRHPDRGPTKLRIHSNLRPVRQTPQTAIVPVGAYLSMPTLRLGGGPRLQRGPEPGRTRAGLLREANPTRGGYTNLPAK